MALDAVSAARMERRGGWPSCFPLHTPPHTKYPPPNAPPHQMPPCPLYPKNFPHFAHSRPTYLRNGAGCHPGAQDGEVRRVAVVPVEELLLDDLKQCDVYTGVRLYSGKCSVVVLSVGNTPTIMLGVIPR